MLNSSLAYIITRSIPEGIILMLAGYILLNLKIDIIKVFTTGLIFAITVSIVRMMPISYGIHTILGMMICGFMLSKISKLPLIQPLIATCGIFIALALSEGVYVMIVNGLLNIPTEILMERTFETALLTMPSLLIFIIIILVMKSIINKLNIKSKVS